MKKNLFFFAMMVVAIALFSFTMKFAAGIKGTVSPAESAGTVWVYSGTDSTSTQTNQGVFEFSGLTPGTYKIVVEAKAPYKNYVKENIAVADSGVVDLGTIQLEQ
jgi:hypothetical protein